MTDNQNVGATPGSGPDGSPSQSASSQPETPIGGEVTQLLAALEGKFSEQFSNLEKQLMGRIEGLGKVQGKIDGSQNELRQWLSKIDQYEKQGFSREEALAEIESDNAADARWQQVFQELKSLSERIAAGGTGQASAQQWMAQALTEFGLDSKDPFVAGKLAGQSPKTQQEAELLAARIFRDKMTAPQTNPSQQPSTPGGAPGGSSNVEALAAEYDRLSVNPAANFERILEIQKELEKLK